MPAFGEVHWHMVPIWWKRNEVGLTELTNLLTWWLNYAVISPSIKIWYCVKMVIHVVNIFSLLYRHVVLVFSQLNCIPKVHSTGPLSTGGIKGKADDLYRSSMQFENHRRTALQYPLVHWTLCRCQQYGAFGMKALARYQVILLGEHWRRPVSPAVVECLPALSWIHSFLQLLNAAPSATTCNARLYFFSVRVLNRCNSLPHCTLSQKTRPLLFLL